MKWLQELQISATWIIPVIFTCPFLSPPPAIIEATTDLLYMSRMMMSVKLSVDCLAGETEVLGECPPVHHRPHIAWPGLEPGPPQLEACD
jgi:hypothetical protein